MSVNNIVAAIRKEIPSFKIEYTSSHGLDVQSFELDITKLRNKLGGGQMTPFEVALSKTIEWQKSISL